MTLNSMVGLSLYKSLRAIKPDNSERHARNLLEPKSEILKLRAQLKHTEEGRDILKKAARYFVMRPDLSAALSLSTALYRV